MSRLARWRMPAWSVLLALCVSLVAPTGAAAQTAPRPSDSDIEYYHTDAIGSVRMITNDAGLVIAQHDYLPFGTAFGQPQPSAHQPRGFAGKEFDPETGFDYFLARYYASQVARFTTVDPGHVNGNIDDPQSWNGYAYARNNPLRYTDPTGTEYEICIYGGPGYSGGCGSVSDLGFANIAKSPGAGIRLSGGEIFAGDVRVGFYNQTSVDPGFNDLVGQIGYQSGSWLSESLKEMAVGAAIAATGSLAAGALSGGLASTSMLGLEAPAMVQLANVTARSASVANFTVNLTAGEFQANLVRGGYRVIRQGVSSNGRFTVLSKGDRTYSIYIRSSTGEAGASVRVAGRDASKISLSGF